MKLESKIVSPGDLNGSERAITQEHVTECASLGPTSITQRMEDLDREWDLDRVVALAVTGIGVTGALLGTLVGRKWALLSLAAAALVAPRALGMSPLRSLGAKLGVRTRHEIEVERNALKALRGDFRMVATPLSHTHPNARATQAILASQS